ncbi:MAG: hypothetical protein A3I68_04495 [Candidatus Melainabacteria bacterium RIFCSPLOWO2_02_FULL_35_15]|nr:MAG: hypothetical protein A3F80_06565 [Candidatus Melainabacteria bacterium RIFCSPLOWO2_12_FULL_35_11]OGI13632.1 MAG: hypothetical protein A3I68_04495 [Candidatus Melainabacteria bacterium RIFCSPLOWO2_02_FULL_35_15]
MSDTQIVPIVLTPMAVVGTKPKSKKQIEEELAKIKDLNPLSKTNLTSGIGGAVTVFELANLLINPKAGALSYIITIGGGILTGLGFLISPSLECEKEPEVLSPPVRPAPEIPPAETPPPSSKKAQPVPEIQKTPFDEWIKKIDLLKTAIVSSNLSKSEKRSKVTELLNILRDTTGKTTTRLELDNHSKLRIYTLELLRDIIINPNEKNEQTISRSLKAILNLFMKDTRDNLKSNAGAALLIIVNERKDAVERLASSDPEITRDKIIAKLKQIKK